MQELYFSYRGPLSWPWADDLDQHSAESNMNILLYIHIENDYVLSGGGGGLHAEDETTETVANDANQQGGRVGRGCRRPGYVPGCQAAGGSSRCFAH